MKMYQHKDVENARLPGSPPELDVPAGVRRATQKTNDENEPSGCASEASSSAVADAKPQVESRATPPYSAFSKAQRNFLLSVVTVAGFFGPLSGGIYLPALPVLALDFNVSDSAINATVSVFMVVFAVGVRSSPLFFFRALRIAISVLHLFLVSLV